MGTDRNLGMDDKDLTKDEENPSCQSSQSSP